MTEARFYYRSAEERSRDRERQDPDVLGRVIREAGVEYRAVDTSGLEREELEDAYAQLAVTPSVRRGYRIKHIFGTNKYPGSKFGKDVPALVVLENGRPQDVYPHEEGGRLVTIKDYLDGLRKSGRSGAELARRMDALSAKIGKIGVSTSELIEQGRRR